jgi:hypothetical protein
MSDERLVVDPIRCDAYGPMPERLRADARRAVAACPRLALTLEARARSKP